MSAKGASNKPRHRNGRRRAHDARRAKSKQKSGTCGMNRSPFGIKRCSRVTPFALLLPRCALRATPKRVGKERRTRYSDVENARTQRQTCRRRDPPSGRFMRC